MSISVRINETGEIKELSLIDNKSGVDWVGDFIGNAGGWDNFGRDDEDGIYTADAGDYKWWQNVISKYDAAQSRFESLCAELADPESLKEDMRQTDWSDLELLPDEMQATCDLYDPALSNSNPKQAAQ